MDKLPLVIAIYCFVRFWDGSKYTSVVLVLSSDDVGLKPKPGQIGPELSTIGQGSGLAKNL